MNNIRHFFYFIKDGQFKRAFELVQDYLLWGCTEVDAWNLDMTLAKFALPRLLYFRWRQKHGAAFGVPMGLTTEEWEHILEEMTFALECVAHDIDGYTKEEEDRIKHGLELFGQYFRSLWN